MNRVNKKIHVAFVDVKLKEAFEKLKAGKFEDKRLYAAILSAANDLKKNPVCGIPIPKKINSKVIYKKISC